MRPHTARPFAITGILFALGACNIAQKIVPDPIADTAELPYKIERWQRDIELTAAIKSIKVENLHGNLTLKQTDAASIGIQGVEQKLGRTPEHARLEVSTVGGQLQLSIIYASDAVSGTDARVDGHLKGRVDLAVFVPKDVALELRTSHGDLVVRRLHNPIRAQSGSGRISVSTSQVSELISQTGNINYLPSDCAAASGAKIHTNGKRAVVDVPVYCPLLLDVYAESLILGQKSVALTAGHWQRQFPQEQQPQPNLAATPVMQIATPNAALTLSVMREKNSF